MDAPLPAEAVRKAGRLRLTDLPDEVLARVLGLVLDVEGTHAEEEAPAAWGKGPVKLL